MRSSHRIALVFLLWGVLLVTLLVQTPTQGAPSAQATPCVSWTNGVFVFALAGYRANGDGSYTLTWQVTNHGKQAIGYVALGTASWRRSQPQHGSRYTGHLGDYRVAWTNDQGNPGFASVKYEAQFASFSQGATENLTLVVSNFDPAALVQVQAKAGQGLGTARFTLSTAPCDRTPPTPIPTPPFSPLPTPDPSLTLDDYTFSAPRVVITSPYGSLAILDWLPDNQRAIIMPGETFELQSLDVTSGVTVTYGNIGPTHPDAVWLEAAQKLAFRSAAGGAWLLFSDGPNEPAIITSGNFRQSLAGRGNRVMILNEGEEAPLLFDGEGNQLPVPPINVLDYGLNKPMRTYGPEIRWHPFEDKVVMADEGGIIIFDLVTGDIQDFDLLVNGISYSELPFGPYLPRDVQWSPDGQKIAFELVLESMLGRSWLVLLDRSTGQFQNIQMPSTLLSDYAWASNGRQLYVVGRDQAAPRNWVSTVYFLDTLTGDYRTIDSLSGLALGGYQGDGTAWSPDGHRLLYRCRPATMPKDLFGVCESTVAIGGGQ